MKTYIGIDLGGTNVRVSSVREDGTVLDTVKSPSYAQEGAEKVLYNIIRMIKEIPDYKSASGIGIAVPGPVSPEGDKMAMCTNIPCLKDVNIRGALAKEFDMPIYLGNDADAAGLAEAVVGAGKGLRTVIYVTISTGIGGALVFDGKLLPGAHGFSMEVGSISVDNGRKHINLPADGAIEDWASGTNVTRMGREKMPEKNLQHAGEVMDLAKAGDPLGVEILDHFAKDLATMFANLAVTIDPDCFVLGGGMMKSAEIFMPKVIEQYKARILPALKDIPFFMARLDEPGVVGAAMIPMSQEK